MVHDNPPRITQSSTSFFSNEDRFCPPSRVI